MNDPALESLPSATAAVEDLSVTNDGEPASVVAAEIGLALQLW